MTWIIETPRSQQQLAEDFIANIGTDGTLPIVGAHDGMSSLLARKAGFSTLYLSGGALSASKGIPDIGLLTLDDVTSRAREIVRASGLPLLVDVDNGFGEPLNVARTCLEMVEAGVAAIQIEDQQIPKKCGHLNGKKLIPADEMVKKIQMIKQVAPTLKIVARSDAYAIEGMQGMLERLRAYAESGAHVVFPEAMRTVEDFKNVREALNIPILANMTEFGKTDYIKLEEFADIGIDMVIFPVTSLRVAAHSVQEVYEAIQSEGTQKSMLDKMQTRKELYEILRLHEYENMDSKIDRTVLPDDLEEKNEI
ncbi:methylisocitrate lyase [Salinicoccus roseus]|uniref:Methylisocitrate lyase n=1 Tax=Salinicoccus roseus TaxID=45670 RepID=A0A0C2DKM1_9STAP|nr:methylisocitrate lyase [Salinicoccus roseus]KIH70568.1 methylisocitrate lyase [Salinicoccus roseus]MDB0580662.1 methylisocitrate lyase [Salinicoccus roseus]